MELINLLFFMFRLPIIFLVGVFSIYLLVLLFGLLPKFGTKIRRTLLIYPTIPVSLGILFILFASFIIRPFQDAFYSMEEKFINYGWIIAIVYYNLSCYFDKTSDKKSLLRKTLYFNIMILIVGFIVLYFNLGEYLCDFIDDIKFEKTNPVRDFFHFIGMIQ